MSVYDVFNTTGPATSSTTSGTTSSTTSGTSGVDQLAKEIVKIKGEQKKIHTKEIELAVKIAVKQRGAAEQAEKIAKETKKGD